MMYCVGYFSFCFSHYILSNTSIYIYIFIYMLFFCYNVLIIIYELARRPIGIDEYR